ncbi:MAG: 30S ribosomal protein S21 [Verrucomicrobiia bacterium]
MSEVKLKKGESADKALRRLKRKLDREGTLREARVKKYFEKPSVRRLRKAKEARQNLRRRF